MRRVLCLVMACVSVLSYLCMDVGAIDESALNSVTVEDLVVQASGSFNISVGPYKRTAADTSFPMAAGETVRIRANYAPEDASMDFGLVDSDGIFHYVNVKTGSINVTIEVPKNGYYTLAIRNNTGNEVKVSGIVTY